MIDYIIKEFLQHHCSKHCKISESLVLNSIRCIKYYGHDLHPCLFQIVPKFHYLPIGWFSFPCWIGWAYHQFKNFISDSRIYSFVSKNSNLDNEGCSQRIEQLPLHHYPGSNDKVLYTTFIQAHSVDGFIR